MNRVVFFVLLASLAACQQSNEPSESGRGSQRNSETTMDSVVTDAEGLKFSLNCLRANAQDIRSMGRSAAERCIIQTNASSGGRGAWGNSISYTADFYLPWYWGYGQNNGWGWSSSYYTDLCSYVFGISWGSNSCYSNIFRFPYSYVDNRPRARSWVDYGWYYYLDCQNTPGRLGCGQYGSIRSECGYPRGPSDPNTVCTQAITSGYYLGSSGFCEYGSGINGCYPFPFSTYQQCEAARTNGQCYR